MSLAELLSQSGQSLDVMLHWAIEDFTFFSWDSQARLTLTPENLETCMLVDRLIFECNVPMGKNQGQTSGSIVWAWKKGGFAELRKLGRKYLKN